jgi:hypothetical protein
MARTSEEKLDYKVVQLLKDKAVIDDARMLGFAIEQFNDVLPACVVRVGGGIRLPFISRSTRGVIRGPYVCYPSLPKLAHLKSIQLYFLRTHGRLTFSTCLAHLA